MILVHSMKHTVVATWMHHLTHSTTTRDCSKALDRTNLYLKIFCPKDLTTTPFKGSLTDQTEKVQHCIKSRLVIAGVLNDIGAILHTTDQLQTTRERT